MKSGNPPRRTRDPAGSQRALLSAATKHFSAHGLKGARIDEIAKTAGVNKQLVYHYFGSKDELYLKVLEDVYENFRAIDQELKLSNSEPVAALRRLIASTVGKMLRQQQFPALVIDENFHRARHVRKSARLKKLHREMLDVISELLKRGQAHAGFRSDVDALQLYTTIASLASYYVTNRHTMEAIFGDRFRNLRKEAVIAAHVEELVLRFLVAPTEADKMAYCASSRNPAST